MRWKHAWSSHEKEANERERCFYDANEHGFFANLEIYFIMNTDDKIQLSQRLCFFVIKLLLIIMVLQTYKKSYKY